MADVEYQLPMQLMELLGLRGWDNATPRVYWGLRRPDGLPADWAAPNAGIGGDGVSYQGGYGLTTGGGGGFGLPTGAPLSLSSSLFSARSAAPDIDAAGALEPGAFSNPDQGLNAVSPTFGDWIGHVATGLGIQTLGMTAPLALGLSNYLGTTPSLSLLGVAREALGAGNQGPVDVTGTGQGITGTRGDEGIGTFAGFGGSPEIAGRSADSGYQGGGADVGATPGDPTGGAGPEGLYRGGPVTPAHLVGPNPRGPDDGFAALDVGEHVLTADEVRALGGHAGVMRLRDLLRR